MKVHPLKKAAAATAAFFFPALACAGDSAALLEETRAVALGMQQQVAARLRNELQNGSPEGAIAVCGAVAAGTAARASRERGWRISRVSLKARNALQGLPDAWEQQALLEFEARQARGEDPAAMERHEIVTEPAGRYFRYIKALPMVQVCMTCHGPREALSDEVRQALAREYPSDHATGYRLGQVRGGLAVKRPL